MISKEQWRAFIDHPVVEWTIFVVGVILIIIGIITGPLPGPGGIFFFAPGLAMVLKTSIWAKRRYVHFKRWEPKVYYIRFRGWRPTVASRRVAPGQWTDWALRRRSARRRLQLRKKREAERAPLADEIGLQQDGTAN